MKNLFFGLLVLGVLFSSCKKDDDLGALGVVIEGTVIDKKTNETLSGVTAQIITKNNTVTTTTDESGYFTFAKLPAGQYTLKLSADGYSSYSTSVGSYDMTTNGSTEELIVNSTIQLSGLTESYTFTAYKYLGSGSSTAIAAANKAYTIRFNNGDTPVSGTTNENGLATITNLPYQNYCYIEFDFVDNGIRYKSSNSYYGGSSNYSNAINIYGYFENGDFGLVSSNTLDSQGRNLSNFAVSDSVVITFTQPVDTANADISFGYNRIDFETTWSEGNMKLELNPSTNLANNNQYYIYIYLESADNTQSLSKYLYFNTEE